MDSIISRPPSRSSRSPKSAAGGHIAPSPRGFCGAVGRRNKKLATEDTENTEILLTPSRRPLCPAVAIHQPCNRFTSRLLEFAFCCSILYPRHLLTIANV